MECLITDYFIQFSNRRLTPNLDCTEFVSNNPEILVQIDGYELGCHFVNEDSYETYIHDAEGNHLLTNNDGSVDFIYTERFEEIFNYMLDKLSEIYKFKTNQGV